MKGGGYVSEETVVLRWLGEGGYVSEETVVLRWLGEGGVCF